MVSTTLSDKKRGSAERHGDMMHPHLFDTSVWYKTVTQNMTPDAPQIKQPHVPVIVTCVVLMSAPYMPAALIIEKNWCKA
ncbi:MAG TPA: hypothetical protein DEQ79_07075 [Alphaproteobacteria bacterium]|nr:hypothetical protein [Alphaproteobacteria bacterium]|tara:strand:- start:4474 stop:4713 length:240 start_codon:yes stop_codon:yes gene_type:complete